MVLKTDPETQEQYWTRERVTVYKAEASDRINAVLDILKGVTTAEEVQKKYDITSINSVYIWIGKYVSQEKSLSLEEQTYEDMATKSKDDQIRELKAQLKQARKEAELEKLRAHAYDTMINLAEEKFNIPIRKKSGTKQ
jgi:transposase-like protein